MFNRLFVAMVEAGESSGTLDTVLDRIAMQIEKETQIKRRVKSAMVYPTVVLTFATLVLVFMLLFIVPVFVKVFDQLNGQLPTPTRIVMGASNGLRAYWFMIFPAIGLAHLRASQAEEHRAGRQRWDRIKLEIPMKIGDVVQKIALARFSRTLSTLMSAGVDIITALEITGGTAGNYVIEQALVHARERVHEGVPISGPLADDPIFPPMVSQMVKIGEETGELDKMLGKVADFYEDEVDASIAVADLDHRADPDDRRRRDGRDDRHLDVPADVQAADADQVAAAACPTGLRIAAFPARRLILAPSSSRASQHACTPPACVRRPSTTRTSTSTRRWHARLLRPACRAFEALRSTFPRSSSLTSWRPAWLIDNVSMAYRVVLDLGAVWFSAAVFPLTRSRGRSAFRRPAGLSRRAAFGSRSRCCASRPPH